MMTIYGITVNNNLIFFLQHYSNKKEIRKYSFYFESITKGRQMYLTTKNIIE